MAEATHLLVVSSVMREVCSAILPKTSAMAFEGLNPNCLPKAHTALPVPCMIGPDRPCGQLAVVAFRRDVQLCRGLARPQVSVLVLSANLGMAIGLRH